MNYYLKVFQNYATFSGRARRSEYWYFVLFNTIAIFVLMFLSFKLEFPYLIGIYYLVTLIPGLAVSVRRMHDVGKSGWFVLIPIYNLVLVLTPGDKGDNQYGKDPKNEDLSLKGEVEQY